MKCDAPWQIQPGGSLEADHMHRGPWMIVLGVQQRANLPLACGWIVQVGADLNQI